MPDSRNRKRPIWVKFFIDEKRTQFDKGEDGATWYGKKRNSLIHYALRKLVKTVYVDSPDSADRRYISNTTLWGDIAVHELLKAKQA